LAEKQIDWESFGRQLEEADKIEESVYGNLAEQRRQQTDHFGDTVTDVQAGVLGAGRGLVGLADLVTPGQLGKVVDEYTPLDEWEEQVESQYSPARQQAQADFANAEGITGKIGEIVKNPSLATSAAIQSAPSMLAGGGVARAGASLLSRGTKYLPKAADYLSKLKGVSKAKGALGKNAGAITRGAVGEGLISAGQQAEDIRSQTDTGETSATQDIIAAVTGAGTAAFGALGGRVAQKLGLADPDILAAGGDVVGAAVKKGMPRRAAETAFVEGIFEELPQSAQEQMLNNIALDRPVTEGLEDAVVMGAAAGGVMGGATGMVFGGGKSGDGFTIADDPKNPAETKVQPEQSEAEKQWESAWEGVAAQEDENQKRARVKDSQFGDEIPGENIMQVTQRQGLGLGPLTAPGRLLPYQEQATPEVPPEQASEPMPMSMSPEMFEQTGRMLPYSYRDNMSPEQQTERTNIALSERDRQQQSLTREQFAEAQKRVSQVDNYAQMRENTMRDIRNLERKKDLNKSQRNRLNKLRERFDRLTRVAPEKRTNADKVTREGNREFIPVMKRKEYRDVLPEYVRQNVLTKDEMGMGTVVDADVRGHAGKRTPSTNAAWAQDAIGVAGSAKALRNAVNKAAMGEPLGENQRIAVEIVADAYSRERVAAGLEEAKQRRIDTQNNTRMLKAAEGKPSSQFLEMDEQESAIYAEFDDEAKTLHELTAQAYDLADENSVDALLESDLSDGEIAAELYNLIERKTDGRQSQAGETVDRPAETAQGLEAGTAERNRPESTEGDVRQEVDPDQFPDATKMIETEQATEATAQPTADVAIEAGQGQRSESAAPDFEEMVKEAARWRGAALNHASNLDKKGKFKVSQRTTKGDLDEYLMRRYGIDETAARDVSNALTQRNVEDDRTADPADYEGEAWQQVGKPVASQPQDTAPVAPDENPAQADLPAERIKFVERKVDELGSIEAVDKKEAFQKADEGETPQQDAKGNEDSAPEDTSVSGEDNAQTLRQGDGEAVNIGVAYNRLMSRGDITAEEGKRVNEYFSGTKGMERLENLDGTKPVSDLMNEIKEGALGKNKPEKDTPGKTTREPKTNTDKKESSDAKGAEIDDFGEKLEGARKDMGNFTTSELESDSDIAASTLSKIWPKAEVDRLDDPQQAAFATVLRGMIPSKPRKRFALARWVDSVKTAKTLMEQLESKGFDAALSRMRSPEYPGLGVLADHIEVMAKLPRESWGRIDKIEVRPNAYHLDKDGKEVPAPFSMARIDGRNHHFDSVVELDAVAENINALLTEQPQGTSDAGKFEIRTQGGRYFINRKGDGEYRTLVSFDTFKEAKDFRKNETAKLAELWEAVKERDNVKKTDVRRKENRPRTGTDRRKGQDVTAEQFEQAFGFRGVQFGNWVKQGKAGRDRQGMLNQAYDALHDLADIVGIPSNAISLNGELGLAFGARGSGNAAAHYEPGTIVINLTKTKGAGSLAHEWFHALDHYFSRKRTGDTSPASREESFITYKPERLYVLKDNGRGYHQPLTMAEIKRRHERHPTSKLYNPENWQLDPNHPEGVRPEVEAAFADLVNQLNESPMSQRARVLDKGKADGYWGRIIERAARAFENYVIDKMMKNGYRNDYLANVTEYSEFARNKDRYPYLKGDELEPVANAFDNLFGTIETRETDRGVEIFEGPETYGTIQEGGSSNDQLSFDFNGKDTNNRDTADGNIRPSAGVSLLWRKGSLPIKRSIAADLEARLDTIQTGTFKSGITQINTPSDAAHVLAPLRKSGVEKFHVLVLDKDKAPRAIIDVSTGTVNSSLVHPREVVGPALDIPGAASVYFGHNHPSGVAEPSREDTAITDRLQDLFSGTGVEYAGHVIFGENGEYRALGDAANQKAAPGVRKSDVPVMQRKIVRRSQARGVTGPDDVAKYLRGNGVLLLDSKNKPVAWVEMTDAEMGKLRTGGTGSGSALLSRAASQTGAAGIIVSSQAPNAWKNVARYADKAGMRMLDAVVEGQGSVVAKGGSVQQSGPFYSKSTEKTNNTPAQVEKEAKSFLGKGFEKMKQAGTLKVVQSVEDLPKGGLKSTVSAKEKARRDGYDVDNIYYHRTYAGESLPEAVRPRDVLDNSNFYGGIFATTDPRGSSGPQTHGDLGAYVARNALKHGDDVDVKRVEDAVRAVSRETLTAEEMETVYDVVVDDVNFTKTDISEERWRDILGEYDEIYPIDAFQQVFRGEVAREMGFDVIDTYDEHGVSQMLLGGGDVRFLGRVDSESTLFSRSGDIAGMYQDGTVHLVADQIAKGETAGLLKHEGLHLLLRNDPTFKKRKGEIMRQFKNLKNTPKVKEAYAVVPKETDQNVRDEEALAYLVQNHKEHSLVKRIISAVKAWMFRNGIPVTKLTEGDLTALAAQGVKRFSKAQTMEQALAQADAMVGSEQPVFSRKRTKGTEAQEKALRETQAVPKDEMSWHERVQDWMKGISENFNKENIRQSVFDEYASVERAEKQKYGKLLDADFSPSKALRATKNLDSVMAAIFMKGKIRLNKNGWTELVDPENGKGFLKIFEPLFQYEGGSLTRLWEGYAGARRARELKAQNRENNYSDEYIRELLTLGDEYDGTNGKPDFKAIFDEYQAFNKSILDFAEAAGVIDPETRKFWESNDYIPMYRILDAMAEAVGPSKKGGVANQTSGIRKLEGGVNKHGGVLENMVMNMTKLVDASYKNIGAERAIDLGLETGHVDEVAGSAANIDEEQVREYVNDVGLDYDAMDKNQQEAWRKTLGKFSPEGGDIVHILKDGKRKYYRVNDPLFLRSLQSVGGTDSNVLELFRMSKSLLTNTVTADPSFMLANFLRDSISTWMVTGTKMIPVLSGIKQGMKAWNEDTMLWQMMAAGAGGGRFYNTRSKDVRKMANQIEKKMKDKNFSETVLDSPGKIWQFWQKMGNASENANRLAVMQDYLNRGYTLTEAAYQAMDVMNFTRHGDGVIMKFMMDTVPFLNARIQGLDRLYRGAKENPGTFAIRGAMMGMASLALYMANKDREEYDDLPEWDKDIYWHFFTPVGHYRFPKSFEVGAIFGTLPERIAEAISKGETRFLADATKRMVMDTFAFDPMPQLVRPAYEIAIDRNRFFDMPIVGFDKYLEPEAQYNTRTPVSYVKLAEAMPDIAPDFLRSPKQLEHLVRGYTSSVGSIMFWMADRMMEQAGMIDKKETLQLTEAPVIKRFFREHDPRSVKYSSYFYDMVNEADQIYKTVNKYMKYGRRDDARELIDDNRELLQKRKGLNRYKRQISEINRTMDKIARSSLAPAIKDARNRKLQQQKNRLQKRAVEIYGEGF
jgi:hypothetical protein